MSAEYATSARAAAVANAEQLQIRIDRVREWAARKSS